MLNKLNKDWKIHLKEELDKNYFFNLTTRVKQEYSNYTCFPPIDNIFNSLNFCVLSKLKVVIIGQDPYHQQNQADGLSFSVGKNVKIPPSLNNIFKELNSDINKPLPTNGDLTYLSKQGVLLLNSCLSVRMSSPGSHYNFGWERFTDKIISIISEKKSNVVFLLWGSKSISKSKLIDTNKHLILTSGHPSPLSANRGYWFGNRHFSKTNDYLKNNGLKQIYW
ncbi:MAG: uracil-DNA glycosylase [Flavobacteriaceae bacterium]|nr:uracil-DNA glycosylase [Flavobacteriaceae bacterium]